MPASVEIKSLKVFDFDYAYLDSGAPPSHNYTTWVLLHGMAFNGAVLETLFPLAPAYNIRIVSVYRRGYTPSSGFQPHELEMVGFGKKYEEAEPFFRSQGIEIATFIAKFATEQGIPEADPNSPTGGIVVIGWSLGGIHTTALLAYLDQLTEDIRATVLKYLHTVLCHDASSVALGIPNTDKHNVNLWLIPDDQERLDAFFDWATGHYVHKSVTSENEDDLEFNTPSGLPHSLYGLSYEERSRYTDVKAFGYNSCDGKLLFCDVTAFAMLTRRAFFDKALAAKSPNVRARFMSSGTTPGVLVWTLWMFRKYVENPPEAMYGAGAEKSRDMKFISQTDGNHFIFWDDPEKAIQQYKAVIT